MTRRMAREQAFILVFETLFSTNSLNEIMEYAEESLEQPLDEYAIFLAKEVSENTQQLDEIFEKYLKNWSKNRISKVSLAVLRIAVYEICMATAIPDSVAINEAVELMKKFSVEKEAAFVNGILGSIVKEKAANTPGEDGK